MRNPVRLNVFYAELKTIHQTIFPDWRFGQFMSNFLGWVQSEKKKDFFVLEEDQMTELIREYAEIYKR